MHKNVFYQRRNIQQDSLNPQYSQPMKKGICLSMSFQTHWWLDRSSQFISHHIHVMLLYFPPEAINTPGTSSYLTSGFQLSWLACMIISNLNEWDGFDDAHWRNSGGCVSASGTLQSSAMVSSRRYHWCQSIQLNGPVPICKTGFSTEMLIFFECFF